MVKRISSRWAGKVTLALWVACVSFASAAPFDAWLYRAKFRIGTAPNGALTNFPLLVQFGTNIGSFSYSQLSSPTNAADLRFTASNGTTELSYDIDTWNTNGQSFVWVQVPLITSTNDYVYAYWGKAGSTTPAYVTNGATWGTTYRAVWHFPTNAVSLRDSTTNRILLSNTGTDNRAGRIAGARNFDLNDYLSCADTSVLDMTDVVTMETWMYSDSDPQEWENLFSKTDGSANNYRLFYRAQAFDDILISYLSGGTWYHWYPAIDFGLNNGAWYHVVGIMDTVKDVREIYVNGRLKTRDTTAIPAMTPNNGPFYIGREAGSYPLDGAQDEVRVSSIARGSNWVYATWLNVVSNTTFLKYESREYQATSLTVVAESPTGIGVTNATMRGQVTHAGNAANPRTYILWDISDQGTAATSAWAQVLYLGTNWGQGQSFSTNVMGLTSGNTYSYRCYVTNSTGRDFSDTVQTFNTIGVPTLTNTGATALGHWTATLQGVVTNTGGEAPSIWFDYWESGGAITTRVAMGIQSGGFSWGIVGLEDTTTYQYKILGSNAAGTAWSTIRSFSTTTPAHRWFVATNGTDTAGTNWSTAYRTLQQALTGAVSNDVVYLAGHRFPLGTQILWTVSHVGIRGGHAATNDSGAGPFNPETWPTTLVRTGGNYRIFFLQSVTNGTLEAVTVANGYANAANGGGAQILNCVNLAIRNCSFTNNQACLGAYHVRGGAIYATNSSVTMEACTIKDNQARSYDSWDGSLQSYGGGLYAKGGTWIIRHSVIGNNKVLDGALSGSAAYGCGLAVNATVTLDNCLVAGNSHRRSATDAWPGGGYGAGIYVEGGTLTVQNATIANNNGEGIRRGAGTVTVRDSILWHNGTDVTGTVTLLNSIVSDGSGTGPGCFTANPRFERGVYLATGSPGIEAGSRTVAAAGLANRTTRADGTPDTGTVDLGYHYPAGVNPAIADLYVATNGINANAGISWATALRTLGKALGMARDGTRIHVGAGTYASATETFPLRINRPGLQLLGTNWTLTTVNAAGSGKSVFQIEGVAGDGRISGLRITGGYPINFDGGGFHVYDSDLTLADSFITSNRTANNLNWGEGYGGGIYGINSYVSMTNCTVEDNHFVNAFRGIGGGMHIRNGNWQVRDTLVRNNTASSWYYTPYAGGIYVSGGTHSFTNSVVHANNAGESDGIYLGAGTLRLANCTVLANLGYGLWRAAGTLQVRDSILWQNGDDVYGTVSLTNSIVEDGDSLGVNGCLDDDPLMEFGYYLSGNSPAIDAGSRSVADAGLTGYTTRTNGIADIGNVDLGYHTTAGINVNLANLYVAPTGDDGNPGTNALAPFRSITQALATALPGTRIHVAAGTYNTDNQEQFPLVVSQVGIQLLGTNRETTIIDARNTGRVLTIANASGNDSIIRGMTLTGGYGYKYGGAVYLDNAQVVLDDCRILTNRVYNADNWGEAFGAGIYSKNTQLRVTNSLVNRNLVVASPFSSYGGGIYINGGNVTIDHSAIITNTVNGWYSAPYGGGVYIAGGTHRIANTVVADNQGSYADGIYVNGNLTLRNCTIAGNSGYGLHYAAGTVSATNSIFWNNGDDLYLFPYAPEEPNPRIWNSCVEDGDNSGIQGCTNTNPLFVDTLYYHLKSKAGHYTGGFFNGGSWAQGTTNSPLIDFGFTESPWIAEPQPNGRRINLGAYGNTDVASKTFLEEPGVFTSLTIHSYPASNLGSNYATLSAEVCHTGGGTDPQAWICWGAADGGTGLPGAWQQAEPMGVRAQWELFSTNISGYAPGSYFARSYITNTMGSDWSELVTFASIYKPSVTNRGAIAVRRRTVTLRGEVLATGGMTPWTFIRYWRTGTTLTNVLATGLQAGLFTTNVNNLLPGSNYQYIAIASNTSGVVLSRTNSFTMLPRNPPIGWYVATNGASTAGTNWSTAMQTLYDAIATAESNDTIYLAGHRFTINGPQFGASRQYDIATSYLTIQGGYAAAGDMDRPGTPDPTQWPTILSRTNYGERIIYIHDCTNTVLRNVTITGGRKYSTGGGIYLNKAIAATIDGCIITSNLVYNTDNWSSAYGAGIYAVNSTVTFTNSLIRANRFENSPFYGRGGGAYVDGGSITFTHCAIVTNYVAGWYDNTSYGGGVFLAAGSHKLLNTVVGNNQSLVYADGIYLNANLQVDRSTIARNFGEGIRRGGGTLTITNSILWANGDDLVGTVAGAAYSCIEDGDFNTTNGCIMVNPEFVDTTWFHLKSLGGYYTGGYFSGGSWVAPGVSLTTSPLIDAGDPSSLFEMEPPVNGGRINIGAYGNTSVASMTPSSPGSIFLFR